MPVFGVEDFYAVGLGLDLAGAYLLAAGVLASLPDIRTSGTWAGLGAQNTVGQVRNKVDATAGVLYLIGGFLLQAAGYTAVAAGLEPGKPSAARALTFAALTAVTLVCAMTVHRLLGSRRTRDLAQRTTWLDGNGLALHRPDGRLLMEIGIELGDDALKGESYGQYARRVWDVSDVENADTTPDEHQALTRQPGRRGRWRRLRA